MKKLGPIENIVFINKEVSEIGEYKDKEDVRYNLIDALQVCMPDSADETVWEAIESVEAYCIKYELTHDPLSEEEIEHIISKMSEETNE